MSIWEYIVLFLSVLLGGSIAMYVRQNNRNALRLILSFGGAYILGITVLHLMPSVFSSDSPHIGLWVLGGFFIQLILEQFSQGVEHGHIHVHQEGSSNFALQIMIGLCLHAFLEGMPLSSYGDFHHHHYHEAANHFNHFFWGIILHKTPAAFALVLLLLFCGFKKQVVWFCLIVFAAMSPLGAALSNFFILDALTFANILAIVIGSFLHISTTILFEAEDTAHHRVSITKMIAIAAGIGLSLLTLL